MEPQSNNNPQPTRSSGSGWFGNLGGSQKYIGIGIQAGVSVAFYLGLGLLLDTWLSTFPWLTLLGILVGLTGMAALFVKMNRELNARSDEAARKKRETQHEEQP